MKSQKLDWGMLKKLLRQLDQGYSEYVPDVWEHQYLTAQTGMNITDTCFSTLTFNKNFRTACHSDKGNFKEGLSVMPVFEVGSYSGGELILPEYDVGFNVREKDLFIFNPILKHCNNPMYESEEDKKKNDTLGLKTETPYISGDEYRFSRLSIVCYLREGLITKE